MEHLLTRNTASLTEFREPGKVLAKAGNEPVAILNRNEAVAYLVPVGAVADITTTPLGKEKLRNYIKNDLPKISHVLEYLKDK
ncbi:prevent-host-death family protein [Polynucleobacter sp. JS-Safj-400b-B2]|uniref:type II toxin-antitoxin system Phd/YefM family antitoxin n=1 Tax=Polynucleobacter sp. JS-Safj-400b-B2 TaxID=2576921 RepID=UPI001C0D6964|nr:type II toxin-antitoxin system Phd/YefM family antitoxin [Polynucleobacter sp. JS-Safj-400b-B2]MBU3625866.1 prevent-host-death family protein [Polynucleobacter sp. JS-Safj-400b-B2]